MSDLSAAGESSFYWPLKLIDGPRRDDLARVYAWCKHVDQLADAADTSAVMVFGWREWLCDGDLTRLPPSAHHLALGLQDAMTRGKIESEWLTQLLDGLVMDLAGEMRAPTMALLTAYCRRVAAMPGRMCLAILGWRGDDAEAFADAAGIAVQLTNILRDIDEDVRMGRLYIPREALDAAGIAASDPAIVVVDPRFAQAWLAIALRAEATFVHAEALLPAARRRQVWPALAMLEISRSLLRRLRARGWRPGARRAQVPRWRRLAIAVSAMAGWA